MGKVSVPRGDEFEIHPEGQARGHIYDVEYKPNQPTQWGPKDKLVVKVRSKNQARSSGEPHEVWAWLNISSHKKSRMRQMRETLLNRSLSEAEIESGEFDTAEFEGKHIIYQVVHNPGTEPGSMFANIQNIMLDTTADTTSAGSPGMTPDMIKQIETWEAKMIEVGKAADSNAIGEARRGYLQTDDLDQATLERGQVYYDRLQTELGDAALPFAWGVIGLLPLLEPAFRAIS